MAFVVPAVLPRSSFVPESSALCARTIRRAKLPQVHKDEQITIEAAKRAQLKGAKKANRRRPKKHRPSDIHRKPPSYNVEPLRDPS